MLKQEFRDRSDGKFQHLILWVSVCTRADERERNGLTAVLDRELQGLYVAGAQDYAFTGKSALPNGPRRVDDVTARQIIAPRDFSVTESEGGKSFAFLVKSRSCGGMNRKIHATVTDHVLVRCIDNGVDLHFCDVLSDYLKWHRYPLSVLIDVIIAQNYEKFNR